MKNSIQNSQPPPVLWYPVIFDSQPPEPPPELWHPVIFDAQPPKPPIELWYPVVFNSRSPEQKSPEPRELDILDSQPPTQTEKFSPPATPPDPPVASVTPATPPESPTASPVPSTPPASYTPVQPNIPLNLDQNSSGRKSTDIRPYDVAQELMARLPMRMVRNALYYFDGKIFRFATETAMNRLIMANCRDYVKRSGGASIIAGVYKIIQSEPNIVYIPERNPPHYVALEDGLLDLDTFALLPHSPNHFITTLLEGSFSRGKVSSCPNFDRFLLDISGGDQMLIERVWQVLGYSLTPDISGKCFFLFQGAGDSGKSVLTNLIASLLEEESIASLQPKNFCDRFGLSALIGTQLCTIPDMPSQVLDSNSVSNFKSLVGGDLVPVEAKYQPLIKLRYYGKFLLATNHPLLTKDYDQALINRAVVVPFRFPIPREQQNPDLGELLKSESDAIIFKALLAYRRLRSQHYQFAGDYHLNEVVDYGYIGATEQQNANLTDLLWNFCCDYLSLTAGGFVSTAELYDSFQKITGIHYLGGLPAFSSQVWPIIRQLFPSEVSRGRTRMTNNGQQERGFIGISLLSDTPAQGGEAYESE